jgi:hypothetical protein
MSTDCGGRSVVTSVESIGIECKLEQDVVHNVLASTRNASEIHGLESLFVIWQVDLRDDDLAIRAGTVQKIVAQRNQRVVGRYLLCLGCIVRKGLELLHDRLEPLIPIAYAKQQPVLLTRVPLSLSRTD